MLEKIFAPVLKFFGIIASSFTVIAAVFTAVGFIAERSHLHMLGFTSIPVDLNQYLYTGARFFALLPAMIFSALGLGTLNLLRKHFLGFMIAILVIIILRLLLRIPSIRRVSQKFINSIKKFTGKHRTGLLCLLMIFQFGAIFQLVTANQISNLLFKYQQVRTIDPTSPDVTKIDKLSSWIINNDSDSIYQHMGWLFLIILVSTIILIEVIATYRKSEIAKVKIWQRLWLGVCLLLLGTQLILFPINHGKLLLPNEFSLVTIYLDDSEKENLQHLHGEKLFLLHQDRDAFYLYSRKTSKVWLIRSNQIHSLAYHGMSDVFKSQSEISQSKQRR
ncbi:MAG: hypothetical protein JSW07_03420 [bacterium]|nr:MAG: hypothetical protein JSW07_03420 [bacterium]